MSIDNVADVFVRPKKEIQNIQINFSRCTSLWHLRQQVRLLCLLITYTPLDKPGARVYYSRAKLASFFSKSSDSEKTISERTIDRWLKDLVDLDLIKRHQQERLGHGKWACPSFSWTEAAISTYILPALALEEERQERIRALKEGRHIRRTKLAHNTEPNESLNRNKPSGEASSDKRSKRKDLLGIPEDLHAIVDQLKLNRMQVLYLFKVCKERNQRLQDVLAVTLPYLLVQQITGKDVVAYLIGVLRSGNDFVWQARQLRQSGKENLRKLRHQRTQHRVVSSLKSGMTLPGSELLLSVTGTHAEVKNLQTGQVFTRLCSQLANYLLIKEPAWTKKLLRGHVECVGIREHLHNRPAEKEPEPDSSRAKPDLSALKALLSRPTEYSLSAGFA